MASNKRAAKKSEPNGHRTKLQRAEPDDPAFLTMLLTSCFLIAHDLTAAQTDGELGRRA